MKSSINQPRCANTIIPILSSNEWEIIAPMLPKPSKYGRPPRTDFREVMNGIFYITKSGCTWENLPHDFPPYSTVYFYFNCIWEVSKRAEAQKGFVIESKRWVVERTFAWIGKYRRLSKDYEFYENTSESSIYIDLIRKMLRNITAVNS